MIKPEDIKAGSSTWTRYGPMKIITDDAQKMFSLVHENTGRVMLLPVWESAERLAYILNSMGAGKLVPFDMVAAEKAYK